jgi:hypothetical protein
VPAADLPTVQSHMTDELFIVKRAEHLSEEKATCLVQERVWHAILISCLLCDLICITRPVVPCYHQDVEQYRLTGKALQRAVLAGALECTSRT